MSVIVGCDLHPPFAMPWTYPPAKPITATRNHRPAHFGTAAFAPFQCLRRAVNRGNSVADRNERIFFAFPAIGAIYDANLECSVCRQFDHKLIRGFAWLTGVPKRQIAFVKFVFGGSPREQRIRYAHAFLVLAEPHRVAVQIGASA